VHQVSKKKKTIILGCTVYKT